LFPQSANIRGLRLHGNTLHEAYTIRGLVTEFKYQGRAEDDLLCYHAVLRPWLWFLTRTSNCRIFQSMSVPDI